MAQNIAMAILNCKLTLIFCTKIRSNLSPMILLLKYQYMKHYFVKRKLNFLCTCSTCQHMSKLSFSVQNDSKLSGNPPSSWSGQVEKLALYL